MRGITTATEQSSSRVFIHVATLCESVPTVQPALEATIKRVYLEFFKLDYLLGCLPTRASDFPTVALLGALLGFDRNYESSMISAAFREVDDYCVDGILNFRLRPLIANWRELASLTSSLLSESDGGEDLYNVAAFLASSEPGDNVLRLSAPNGELVLENLTQNRSVEVENYFERREFDVLLAVLKSRPERVMLSASAPPCASQLIGAISGVGIAVG